jgi:hypothetical protein
VRYHRARPQRAFLPPLPSMSRCRATTPGRACTRTAATDAWSWRPWPCEVRPCPLEIQRLLCLHPREGPLSSTFSQENFPACSEVVSVGIDGDGKMVNMVLQSVLHLQSCKRWRGHELLNFLLSFKTLYTIRVCVEFVPLPLS